MNHRSQLFLATVLVAQASLLFADDVSDCQKLLCTAVQVTECTADGDCVGLPPWELNVPQFIEIDLESKRLATTAASGQNRSTPIKNLERSAGLIFLQGIEGGRAFSLVIAEETGMASIALATDGLAVTVFGACTPVEAFSNSAKAGSTGRDH